MCQSVEDTVFSREFVVTVPMALLVCVSCLQHTEASNMLSGPWETNVSRNGMDPLMLGTSMVNCMCGLMELM